MVDELNETILISLRSIDNTTLDQLGQGMDTSARCTYKVTGIARKLDKGASSTSYFTVEYNNAVL